MKPIIHIKEGFLGNLATILFMLGLAVLAVWLDRRSHGEVSIIAWAFAAIFVLFCYIPISQIRRPKSRLLAFDEGFLLWRIYDSKANRVILEKRLRLDAIRALKWVVPPPADSRRGKDHANARLMFITAEDRSHALPSEFFAPAYRRKIEASFREKLPDIQISEEHESA